jgi:hypothetical protein
MTKIVVAAVLLLAAAAVADAVRDLARPDARTVAPEARSLQRARLVPTDAARFTAAGGYLKKRILRDGREYLSADAIEDAFPVPVEGPIDISKVAVAPNGILVLAVYRFPPQGEARGGIEVWKGPAPIGGFGVPSGYFGGGLAVNRDGSLVATFSYDGQLRGIFDRRGRRVDGGAESFLVVE